MAGLVRRHSGARVKRASPESIVPHECRVKWIPGLRLTAHPGMTKIRVGRLNPSYGLAVTPRLRGQYSTSTSALLIATR
jgi:hypothetical protein